MDARNDSSSRFFYIALMSYSVTKKVCVSSLIESVDIFSAGSSFALFVYNRLGEACSVVFCTGCDLARTRVTASACPDSELCCCFALCCKLCGDAISGRVIRPFC